MMSKHANHAILGLEIPTSLTEEQKLVLKDFEGVTDRQLEQMIRQGKVDDNFIRAFILYIMSGFFCPTSKMAPSPKLFGAIVDVENVQKYNWSRFIFDWLVVQITSYKSSHRKTGSIGGCLFFLMVCNASLFFCCTEASFLAFLLIVYHACVYLSIAHIYVDVSNLIW